MAILARRLNIEATWSGRKNKGLVQVGRLPCAAIAELSYECIANLVVIAALSARGSEMYCIVTPWECLIAIVIAAMWTPLLTAAVAKPRRRLWMVALYQPNVGA